MTIYEIEIDGEYGSLANYLLSKSNAIMEGTVGALEIPAHALYKGDLNKLDYELTVSEQKEALLQLREFVDKNGICKKDIQILIIKKDA